MPLAAMRRMRKKPKPTTPKPTAAAATADAVRTAETQTAATATAAPAAAEDPQAKLQKLKGLLDGGLISADDYEKAKAEVLKQLIN